MKKYVKAKELLATKAENKEKKPIYATRKLSIGLVSCMLGLIMAAPNARAEEVPPSPVVPTQAEAPAQADEDLLTDAEIKEIKDRALNLGDNKYDFTTYRVKELKERLRKIKAENPVNFAQLKKEAIDKAIIEFIPESRGEEREGQVLPAPSINGTLEAGDMFVSMKFSNGPDAETVNNFASNKDIYAYVRVNGIDNIIKLKGIDITFKIPLTIGLKFDKMVSVKIVVTEKNNPQVTLGETPYCATVTVAKKPDPMDKTYKDIVIPTTTVYVDENAGGSADTEIKRAIIKANKNKAAYKNIENDLKNVTYKAANHKATLEFKDGKELEKDVSTITVVNIVASKDAVVNKVTVGDTTITGKLAPYVAGTIVKIYFTEGEIKTETPYPATISSDGTFTLQVPPEKQDTIGKVLKGLKIETIEPDPGKKKSVKLHRVQPKTSDKTNVRDPKNLTDEEKTAIENKIRDKNSSNGQSLLPDGTGDNTGKKARIIFENGNVIIKDATNDRLSSDPIPIADIVNDIKPEQPTITVGNDKLTFAPNSLDTDAKTITITYKDKDNQEKTAEVTKNSDSWTSNDTNVTINNGVITLATSSVLGGSTVTAKVTDNANQTSESASQKTAESVKPPTVTPNQTNGEVTITPPTEGSVDGMEISYIPVGEGSNLVIVKTKKESGTWKIDGKTPNGVEIKGDTGIVTIKKGTAKENSEVKAKSKSGTKASTELNGKVPDKTAPSASTVAVDEKTGNLTITPPTDEDTTSVTVTYKKKDGGSEIKLIAKKGADKTWTLTKEDGTPIDNGESVDANSGVITLEKGKYKTGEEVVAFGNDDAKNKSAEKNATPVEVSFDGNKGTGSIESKIVVVGKENKPQGQSAVLPVVFTLPKCEFTPPKGQEFEGWLVGEGTEALAEGRTIKVSANVVLKAKWKVKGTNTNPPETGGSGTGTGTTPGTGTGTGGTTTPETNPETTPDPSQPDNTLGTTPGSENPTKDKPAAPAKNNPDPKDKPEDKKTGEDNKNNPKTPNVEKGDKVINVGGKEVAVPNVNGDKKKGKLDKEERTKIEEKIKEKNPDVVDVKIDEKANAVVTFSDGRRERIPAKDLLSKEGFMIPRRDRHSQDESPNRRRAGKNVKKGVESIAGIACTLVASTGALYIGRKKED